jgi:hypothetical protein
MPEVTDPKILAELNGTPPRQAPRYQTIRGRVDPYKDEDQQMQRAAANRAEESQSLQRSRDALANEKDRLDIQKKSKELADGDVATAVGEERKAGAFLLRAMGANDSYEKLNIGPRSFIGQGLADNAPSVLNSLPESIGNSPDRQIADTNQDEFIAASLRQDSGAAIPEPELDRQRRIYFPMPGDGPDVIEAKKAARGRAIEGLKQSSGKLLDETLARYNDMRGDVQRSPKIGGDYHDAGGMASQGTTTERKPIPKEMQGEFDAWLAAHGRNFDPQDYAVMRMSLDRKYGYGVEDGTFAEYAKEGKAHLDPTKTFNNSIPGPETSISQIDQMRNNLGQTEGGAALTSGVNAATLGVPALLAGQEGRDALDKLRTDQPIPSFVGDAIGSVLGGKGVELAMGAGARLANIGSRAVNPVSVNTVQGGITGFNNADDGHGIKQGVVASVMAGGATKGMANLASRPAAQSARVIQDAADRQGVEIMSADAGSSLKGLMTAGMAQSPVASGTIIKGANRVNDQIGKKLSDLATSQGAPVRKEVFGDTVRNAAKDYSERSSAAGGRLYDNAAELSQGSKIEAVTARQNIDKQVKELAETPNTSAELIKGLRRFGADIPKGKKLSIDAIRRLRINVRAESQIDGLRGTDYKRRAGLILDDLSNDISAQLPSDAAAAFKKADTFWKERLDNIDDVMSEIIGPQGDRASEKVAQRLINMSRNDSARLRTFVSTLKDDEAGIVRGSIIKEMGRATSANQNAASDAFSLAQFTKTFDAMPDRTKAVLFPGNARHIANDLAIIANGAKAARKFSNTSNTAGAVNAAALVGKAFSGGAAYKTLGLSIPAELLTAQILSHPPIIRSLANLVKINTPARRAAAVSVLQGIIARAPQSADQIEKISNFIKEQK